MTREKALALWNKISTAATPAVAMMLLYGSVLWLILYTLMQGRVVATLLSIIVLVLTARPMLSVYQTQTEAEKYRYLRDEPNPELWEKLSEINEGTHNDPIIDKMESSAEAWDYEIQKAIDRENSEARRARPF